MTGNRTVFRRTCGTRAWPMPPLCFLISRYTSTSFQSYARHSTLTCSFLICATHLHSPTISSTGRRRPSPPARFPSPRSCRPASAVPPTPARSSPSAPSLASTPSTMPPPITSSPSEASAPSPASTNGIFLFPFSFVSLWLRGNLPAAGGDCNRNELTRAKRSCSPESYTHLDLDNVANSTSWCARSRPFGFQSRCARADPISAYFELCYGDFL